MRRNRIKQTVVGLAACGLAIVWSMAVATAGRPTLEGLDKNKPMILPITVKAAYNDSKMFFNLKWEGNKGDTHDLVRFDSGTGNWQKEGGPRREAESTLLGTPLWGPTNLTSTNYESRATWMLNDPGGDHAVDGFGEVGCFATCHDNSRAMPEWDASTGGANKKYLRDDLNGPNAKLDLWHHRMARANPIGVSDDQYIKVTNGTGGRKGDGGESGPYATNNIVTDSDPSHGVGVSHPTWVLNPATTVDNKYAFSFDNVHTDPDKDFMEPGGTPPIGVAESMDYHAALTAGYVPNPDDTVPRRRLRSKIGTPRGDITADGTIFTPIANPNYDPGHYGLFESSTQRLLDTGADDPITGDHSDTILADGSVYDIAFAVHTGMVTVRDHYVGFPLKLSLGGGAGDLEATQLNGEEEPDWSQITELDIDLFLPGITSLAFLRGENDGTKEYLDPATNSLVDQVHGGAGGVTGGMSCKTCHTESGDGAGGYIDSMSMETLVPGRGGVWDPTPRPIPEPTTLVLLTLTGVVGLAVAARRRRQE